MNSQKPAKKALRVQIAQTLAVNFENLKAGISAKKFERNIKKASKALLSGVKKIPVVKEESKKNKKPNKELVVKDPVNN